MNAVRHGLGATNVLLPGEDAKAYEAHLDRIFTSFAPSNDAEAAVVALVADDLFKLERLKRLEHALTLGKAEQMLAETEAGQRAMAVRDSLVILGRALEVWSSLPPDVFVTRDVTAKLNLVECAVDQVEVLVPSLPQQVVRPLRVALTCLAGAEVGDRLGGQHLAAVATEGGKLMGHLLSVGDGADAEQQELRASLAQTALPDEKALKQLGRYAKNIEDGLLRRLQMLEQLRKLSATATNTADSAARAHQYRVKLRVVS